jgi:diguanylate cyclase (GGDEF)-like protein
MSKPLSSSSDNELIQGQTHTALTRQSILAFTVLILSMLVLAGLATSYIAWSFNAKAISDSEAAVRHAIEARKANIAATLVDYTDWDEAYAHTFPRVDTQWTFKDDHIGPTLLDQLGLEGILIVDGAQQTPYALVKSGLMALDAFQWIEGGLLSLVEKARASSQKRSFIQGYYQIEGRPAIVSAALIKPRNPEKLKSTTGFPVLIFVDVLDQSSLASLSKTFNVEDLTAGGQNESRGQLILNAELGVPFLLSWELNRPGDTLLKVMLPLLLATAVVLYLILIKLKRRSLRAAALIDASRVAVQQSEARFRDVAEASSNWIWETNSQRELTYLSDRFSLNTGFAVSEWLGRPLNELLAFNETEFNATSQDALGNPKGIECFYSDVKSRKHIGHLFIRAVCGHDQITGYRGTVNDSTDEFEARAHYEHLSKYDPLTLLPNRASVFRHIKEQLTFGPTAERPLTIFYLDLDDFKHVNDTQGHGFGDKVLVEVSNRLKRSLSPDIFIARQGGDEFVIVVTGHQQPNIEMFAECLLSCFSTPLMVEGQAVRIGASIGIVQSPTHGLIKSELLRFADIALYEAKGAGRNTWCIYDSAMNERLLQRQQVEQDLRLALQRDELRLVFQPRFSIEKGHILGVEALVRWEHPERGLLSPALFIPIAEQSGLIVALSDWVLRKACLEALAWRAPVFVSVNLSCIEFQRSDLVERIRNVLVETQLEPSRLELEITESVMLDNAESALALMHELKALGVKLSMDDFGTGYSSLSYLSQYPFDGIKIDRSFIMSLSNGETNNQAIIKAIVALGKALSMSVTAEGVETNEQLQTLASLDCDQAQGFYLGKPIPIDALTKLFENEAAK